MKKRRYRFGGNAFFLEIDDAKIAHKFKFEDKFASSIDVIERHFAVRSEFKDQVTANWF